MNPSRSLFIAALLGLGVLVKPAAALTVRVESAGGAPRIVVDGEPVRARMFWGSPGWSALPLEAEWKRIAFDFTATGSAENGTMHLRFGPSAGDVFLDDIEVRDADSQSALVPLSDFEAGEPSFTRDWTFWPAGAANTVGRLAVEAGAGREGSAGLHVELTAPRDGNWPDFHIYHHTNLHIVEGHRYRVSLWVRGTPSRSMSVEFHRPGKPFVRIGGPPDAFTAQIKLAAAAGVNFVSFPIALPWPKPGETVEWDAVDAACKRVLSTNTRALLLPRIPMDPPDWWRAAHPDEVMQWDDGRRDKAVVASPVYRREAAERLSALVVHLEEKFGGQIAGYHPAGQNTGEWFYESTWKQPLNGYAPADRAAWRHWLKERYRTDDALRRAWNDAGAALAAAEVPPPNGRRAAPAGIFHDPEKERVLIDWAEFQQQAMAECVCELAHAAREASHGRKLVVFFYGYVFELAGMTNGPATSGHFALRRVLDCPDIDVLCAPISYFDRGPGGGAPAMTAAESVALAGKLWLNEDDTHTYLATGTPPGFRDHVATLEATNAELTRNVAQEALRNFGTWWMDLTATGWFNDPAMWRRMTQLRTLDDALLKTPTPFRPEVAAVIDERAFSRVSAEGRLATWPGIYEARRALGRMGAPYGQYLLDDVLAGRVKAKLYVILNAWNLSAPEREKLLAATRGSARIWCYAPGYFDSDSVSPAAMQQLTGFRLSPASLDKAWAIPTDAGRKLALQQAFGVEKRVRPLFAAADARPAETLATFPDGSAAVTMRRGPDGASFFVGAPALSSELLRIAAREAGVHLFTTTDANVYASGGFVAVHASDDGPLELELPQASDVVDALTSERVGRGPRIPLLFKRGETRVLRY